MGQNALGTIEYQRGGKDKSERLVGLPRLEELLQMPPREKKKEG